MLLRILKDYLIYNRLKGKKLTFEGFTDSPIDKMDYRWRQDINVSEDNIDLFMTGMQVTRTRKQSPASQSKIASLQATIRKESITIQYVQFPMNGNTTSTFRFQETGIPTVISKRHFAVCRIPLNSSHITEENIALILQTPRTHAVIWMYNSVFPHCLELKVRFIPTFGLEFPPLTMTKHPLFLHNISTYSIAGLTTYQKGFDIHEQRLNLHELVEHLIANWDTAIAIFDTYKHAFTPGSKPEQYGNIVLCEE